MLSLAQGALSALLFLHPHSAEVILFTPHFTGKKTEAQ